MTTTTAATTTAAAVNPALSALVVPPMVVTLTRSQTKALSMVRTAADSGELVSAALSQTKMVREIAAPVARVREFAQIAAKAVATVPANFSGVARHLNREVFASQGDAHFIGAKQSECLSARATLNLWAAGKLDRKEPGEKTLERRAALVEGVEYVLGWLDHVRTMEEAGTLKLK